MPSLRRLQKPLSYTRPARIDYNNERVVLIDHSPPPLRAKKPLWYDTSAMGVGRGVRFINFVQFA